MATIENNDAIRLFRELPRLNIPDIVSESLVKQYYKAQKMFLDSCRDLERLPTTNSREWRSVTFKIALNSRQSMEDTVDFYNRYKEELK